MSDEQKKKTTAEQEEEILAFWRENKIFEKSLEQTKNGKQFVFYDGPPFATGLPHYGHILASVLKDVIPRYQTMRGRYVPRKWGWDCHGLPLENIVEQELGFKHKKEIENYGIAKFNRRAEEIVLRYADDWRRIIPRIGRWVDMENDYRTMDTSYTESVWWIFKTLYDNNHIYEGHKSMHLCPRCETTLANFEVSLGYKDIKDISVTVTFKLEAGQKVGGYDVDDSTFVLAWTTTPWTLPGNVALAVNPNVVYVYIRHHVLNEGIQKIPFGKDFSDIQGGDEYFIVAKELAEHVMDGKEYEIIREYTGKDLLGIAYMPLFNYFASDKDLVHRKNGWKIYGGEFVTIDEGTGVVHIAPAFGDEDMQLGKKYNLPFVQHVTMDGRFTDSVKDFAGAYVKPKENHQETDIEIIKYLAHTGRLFSKKTITHSYPFCWRCDTPLLNYAASSWFVNVPDMRESLIDANRIVTWTPSHLKEGRFGKGLETAPDWSISRSRYWGAPLPVWRCTDCKNITVIGSLAELEEKRSTKANMFFTLRHGERSDILGDGTVISEVKDVRLTSNPEAPIHMTPKGKKDIVCIAKQMQNDGGIDYIYSSDFVRARETAQIVSDITGAEIIFDERLREIKHGTQFEGRTVDEYWAYFDNDVYARASHAPEGGESLYDVRKRMVDAIRDINTKHEDKRILIVSHGDPLWVLHISMNTLVKKKKGEEFQNRESYPKQGEMRLLPVHNIPFDERGELNMHRPYVDDIQLACPCSGVMRRIPEVFDCWFESGSMPYAQHHYKGEPLEEFNPSGSSSKLVKGFPADFIAEGLDQTRGWFYSLHVLSVALFNTSAYKNVLVNGTILATDGQKMSKRLKNYPDPMEVVSKYGADALRLYFLSSPAVIAEDLNFSENGVDEVAKKVIARLSNVVSFYDVYKTDTVMEPIFDENVHVLDQYIIYELMQTKEIIECSMDQYRLDRSVRALTNFIDIFSTVYLQYSRDRFREDADDRVRALGYFRFVLIEYTKILAPFAPFIAEHIYRDITQNESRESVHLEKWPNSSDAIKKYTGTHDMMGDTLRVIETILAARSKVGIPVRQPLAKATIKKIPPREFQKIIMERTNIEALEEDVAVPDDTDVVLDTDLTEDLRAKGLCREVIRDIQDMRKKKGMQPGDVIQLLLYVESEILALEKGADKIGQAVGAVEVLFADTADGMQELRRKGVYARIKKK